MLKKFSLALFIALVFTISAAAQETEVDRYQITARIDPAASAVDARASLAISNLSQSSKSRLYFRLTKLAKVASATVNGATAQVETSDDRRVTTLNQIIITPQTPVAGGGKATVEISYRIEAPESSPLVHIYPGEVLLASESVWFPMPTTIFTMYGPTTAPFTLTVTVPSGSQLRAMSTGALKSESSGDTAAFEQPLNSLPFILAGAFRQPTSSTQGGIQVFISDLEGTRADATARENIRALLMAEAGRIIDFLTRTLGPPSAGATFRIISSARVGNLTVPGALVLSDRVFRQDALDANTIELLADALARIWIDGRVRIRGQEARSAQEGGAAQKARSTALLRDSLPRYFAALYFEDRFGKAGANDIWTRIRWSYTPVAKSGRDAELGIQTILLPNYNAAVFGKGPLVLRLIAETAGRDKFIGIVKQMLAGGQTKNVTTDDLRSALVKAAGPDVEKLFQQWVDSIIEPDIIVGAPLPSDKPNSQRVNLRNLGTGDVTVPVVATTASGKRVTATATVPSENLTTVELPTAEKITSIEVDPDKLIIQTNYDNDLREGDMKTTRTSAQTLLEQSIAAFNKQSYAEAEAKLREAVRYDPTNALLHSWLARVLATQKKFDEAVKEANTAIKIEPPVASALAWAHIALGQAALSRNQAAEAVEHLRRAVLVADDAPAQFASREALIQAERAAGQSPAIDESVRAYISQLDAAIRQPTSDKLFTLVIRNNLKRFVQGITVSRPSAWTTEILRAQPIDANRVALDVALKVTAEGRDQMGTAVFILHRAGTGWLLEDVQLFNVK
ncbi:MAG TPA: tetratricopeptide repeat protein [Blastocatellia bacterium]|nr:tetratricopeptide repeat protein [Blastocatellia bacterium]